MRKFFTYADPIVPVHHPRVLVETAVEQGAERARLLEGTSVTEAMLAAPEARISYHAYALLTRNALALTHNPSLGLDVGRNTRFGQMGMLGLLLMNSQTIGEALQQAVSHGGQVAPAWQLAFRVEDERVIVRAIERIPFEPYRAFSTEVLLAAINTQACLLYGGALPVLGLSLHFPRPSYAERYRELYDVPMRFDQPHTEIELSARALSARVPFADPATARLAADYLAQQAPLHAPQVSVREQVKQQLTAAIAQPPDLESLARTLQTSTRTLRRALDSVGTSYQLLLDEARRERALPLTRSTQLSLEQIAKQLGFSNVRSFRRAFKRWTGRTPGAYRSSAQRP